MNTVGADIIAWCDIIKIGCDVIYSSYDVIHVLSVITYTMEVI